MCYDYPIKRDVPSRMMMLVTLFRLNLRDSIAWCTVFFSVRPMMMMSNAIASSGEASCTMSAGQSGHCNIDGPMTFLCLQSQSLSQLSYEYRTIQQERYWRYSLLVDPNRFVTCDCEATLRKFLQSIKCQDRCIQGCDLDHLSTWHIAKVCEKFILRCIRQVSLGSEHLARERPSCLGYRSRTLVELTRLWISYY